MSEHEHEDNPEYGKITEEAVQRLRNRMGKVFPIEYPYIRHVNVDSITHVARSIGDDNPLYIDPEYAKTTRYGKVVAPPALFFALGWGSWDLRRGQGLPGVHGLHSGDDWWYYRPVLDGDVLHSTKMLIKAEPMEGRFAGKNMFIQADEICFYNQNDELVAKQHMPVIRAERESAKKTGKYTSIEKSTYTDEEIAQIDKELEGEIPRGGTPRYWEDTEVGEPMDPVVKGPLTLPDMVTWLQGIGSPHVRSGKYWMQYRKSSPKVAVRDPNTGIPQAVERVHWDDWMAAEIGMPSAYDYGSQRGGYATYFATNWVGDEGWVAHLTYQFRGMFFNGDVFRMNGEVIDKWRGAKTGTGYVEVKFSSINNRGDDIMPGKGIFALPSTENGPIQFPVDVAEDGRA
jgi:acyl dehydratase